MTGWRNGISPNAITLMESLIGGPRWIRSFGTVMPLVRDLLKRGMIEKCSANLNQVRLTEAGCAFVEVDPATVPAEMVETPRPVPEPIVVGEIKPTATLRALQFCEPFRKRVLDGHEPGEVVTNLAAQFRCSRATVYRQLRAGGVLPPHGTRNNPSRRVIGSAPQPEAPPPVRVDRDPCFKCGVRADVGCHHQKVWA